MKYNSRYWKRCKKIHFSTNNSTLQNEGWVPPKRKSNTAIRCIIKITLHPKVLLQDTIFPMNVALKVLSRLRRLRFNNSKSIRRQKFETWTNQIMLLVSEMNRALLSSHPTSTATECSPPTSSTHGTGSSFSLCTLRLRDKGQGGRNVNNHDWV